MPPPVTHTGSVSTTFAFSTTVAGTRTRFGSISTTFTLSTTVAGHLVHTGSISTTFTLSTTVSGAIQTAKPGFIDTTFAFSTTVAGTPTHKGAVDTTFAFSTTVAGHAIKSGAVDTTFTLSTTVAGTRTRFGSVSTVFTLSTTVDGFILISSSIDTTFTFSAPIDTTQDQTLLTSSSSLFPERIGVTVGEDTTATHTVIAGVSSRTAGAASILAGDYAFRGLYSIDTTAAVPGDTAVDGNDWVTLASWGDFRFRLVREAGDGYQIRADFINAATDAGDATGTLFFESDTIVSIGLGVTRDTTTGVIQMWKSFDGWLTWTEIPTASHIDEPGALPDSVPDPIVVLGGDLQDGPWVSVYQAQWGATTDITDVDTDEVVAWNYGANIVTGVGGDFYDAFDKTAKDSWEFGSETSYVYSQRSETTDAGTTVRVDFTFNADTANTGAAPAGTTAAFIRDPTPQWENGPGNMVTTPPILFASHSQFSIASINVGVLTRGDDGTPLPFRVTLCDIYGAPQQALSNAMVDSMTWSLNQSETFSFRMPLYDPLTAGIEVVDQEVQIWRGNKLIIWGVIVRSNDSGGEMTYQCKGLMWYFTKRFIGNERDNYINNGSFERNDAWWYPKYAPSELPENQDPANWSAEIVSDKSLTGYPGRSMKLTSNGVMEFGIEANQFFMHEIDAADRPDGITWTAAAWVYVPSADWGEYDADADEVIGERNAAYNWGGEAAAHGLHLLRLDPTLIDDVAAEAGFTVPKVHEIVVASLSEDLERDQWVRLEVSLTSPSPDNGGVRTDWMQVALHAPIGTVYWDEVSLVRNERLFYNDTPQEAIMYGLVEHGQDTAFGKSDLNIQFAAAQITDVTRTRTYDFFNRELISDALEEFSTVWNGADWSIETYENGQRLFAAHHPMKGTRRPSSPLILGRNISKVSAANDGEALANRVAVMSDTGGTGSSRNEVMGYSVGVFGSGLVIEEAINAWKESPLDSLEGQMETALRSKRNGVIPTLTTYEKMGTDLWYGLQTGDIVEVDCEYGGISVQGEHRILEITLDPETDQLDLTLNPLGADNDPMYAQAERGASVRVG